MNVNKQFELTDLRTGQGHRYSSNELRDFIIGKTKCRYELGSVLQERTGLRFECLKDIIVDLPEEIVMKQNIYIVTAVSRVNSDKSSRYMVIVYNDDDCEDVAGIFNDSVPVYSLKIEGAHAVEGEANELSKWFRATMGKAFSFIDIDYVLFKHNYSRVLIFEEKATSQCLAITGYGQTLSYKELILDIIKLDPILVLAFVDEDNIEISQYNKESINLGRFSTSDTEKVSPQNINKRIKKFFKIT